VGDQAGLYILAGLGGRGFALAPLLAEHVAARATGAPSPLPLPLAGKVDPARFAHRRAAKGRWSQAVNPGVAQSGGICPESLP